MKKEYTQKEYADMFSTVAPVEMIDTGSTHKGPPKQGIALCLSGGGYRAMLFHVGALWRLNEGGYLKKIDRISSVSGGSITAAVLGMNWGKLAFDKKGIACEFVRQVVDPIRMLAGISIDISSVLTGMVTPDMTISDELAAAYSKYLFGDATLQDFPDLPRFVINATNVQSGALWRFMKPYMADWRVGKINHPTIPLAVAVAASSAFPPFLSPVNLKLDHSAYVPKSGKNLQCPPFTTDVVLTDGGVYDNLGLEPVWKLFDTILVSDGGGQMAADPKPHSDWAMHFIRIAEVIDNQVRNLRKGQAIGSFKNKKDVHTGAYWGIRSDISHFPIKNPLHCPYEKTLALANTPTRLATIDSDLQERLINWGYAVCDAAMRSHVIPSLRRPKGFVYPEARV